MTTEQTTHTTTTTAGQMASTLTGYTREIYLAGLGAVSRAQSEGRKVFEDLVDSGKGFEERAKQQANDTVSSVRDRVQGEINKTMERANETWGRIEGVFEDRVSRALASLGVPSRKDIDKLNERVKALRDEIQRLKKQ